MTSNISRISWERDLINDNAPHPVPNTTIFCFLKYGIDGAAVATVVRDDEVKGATVTELASVVDCGKDAFEPSSQNIVLVIATLPVATVARVIIAPFLIVHGDFVDVLNVLTILEALDDKGERRFRIVDSRANEPNMVE